MSDQLDQFVSTLCGKNTWAYTGASALLFRDGCLYMEIGKRKHWQVIDGCTIAPLGGIGGSIESGETLLQTLQRETLEEIGHTIEIVGARHICAVYEHNAVTVTSLENESEPAPALLTISSNLYRQNDLSAQILVIATYIARLQNEPVLNDILGVLAVPVELVRQVLTTPELDLGQALALAGVRLYAKEQLPMQLRLKPAWTIESLATALNNGVEEFWSSI